MIPAMLRRHVARRSGPPIAPIPGAPSSAWSSPTSRPVARASPRSAAAFSRTAGTTPIVVTCRPKSGLQLAPTRRTALRTTGLGGPSWIAPSRRRRIPAAEAPPAARSAALNRSSSRAGQSLRLSRAPNLGANSVRRRSTALRRTTAVAGRPLRRGRTGATVEVGAVGAVGAAVAAEIAAVGRAAEADRDRMTKPPGSAGGLRRILP